MGTLPLYGEIAPLTAVLATLFEDCTPRAYVTWEGTARRSYHLSRARPPARLFLFSSKPRPILEARAKPARERRVFSFALAQLLQHFVFGDIDRGVYAF